MGMITSVRAPIPLAEVPRAAEPPRSLQGQDRQRSVAPPVAETELSAALQQTGNAFGPRPTQGFLPRATPESRAAEAAESARKAYIEASRAAGISPLPLP